MPDPQPRSVSLGVRGWLTAATVFASAGVLWIVVRDALSAFVLLFTGVLVAAALRPAVKRLHTRMPFGAAVGVAFGFLVLVTATIAYFLIAPIGSQVERIIVDVPGFARNLQAQFLAAEVVMKNHAFAQQLAGLLANHSGALLAALGGHLLGGPGRLAALAGNALVILLFAVGWTLASDELAAFVLGLCPPAARDDWKRAFGTIGVRLGAYVQGVVLNGFLVGTAMGAALGLLGVPYAPLLGFVIALLQAIPMVGAVISGPIVLLVVLATRGWAEMVLVLIIFAVIQIVDQNVLSPIIFGQRVQLSFLLIIFSTVTGGLLLGISGAFLAVPVAAALQVIVAEIIAPSIRRANVSDSAGRTPIDPS